MTPGEIQHHAQEPSAFPIEEQAGDPTDVATNRTQYSETGI